jgi:hypothetical protein
VARRWPVPVDTGHHPDPGRSAVGELVGARAGLAVAGLRDLA